MAVDETEDALTRSPLAELLVYLREAIYGLSEVVEVCAREVPRESLSGPSYEQLQTGAVRARQAVDQLAQWQSRYS